MKFIIACVGFSLLVLFSLIYCYNHTEKESVNSAGMTRVMKVVKVDQEDARIKIHDIAVIGTAPNYFAIAGTSNNLGQRQLLTSVDSILKKDVNIRWAKNVFDRFDWSDDDSEFIHRGGYISFYNVDSLFTSGHLQELYREEGTHRYYSPALSIGAGIACLAFFLLSYFFLSITMGWSFISRLLFATAFFLIAFFSYFAFYYLGEGDLASMGNGESIFIFHALHWFLFAMIVSLVVKMKTIYRSQHTYQGILFLIIIFAFPFAYYLSTKYTSCFNYEFVNSVFNNGGDRSLANFIERMIAGFGIGFAGLTVFGINNYKELKKNQALSLQSQLRTKEQLNSLNARLNPHFLYNSLNAIAGLIDPDPRKAEEMTMAISRFLKHFSNRKEEHVITVREEVAVILDYISIEKIRFEDKLSFDFAVEDEAMDINMPRSILQPLIENAVKYGYNKESETLEVKLKINREGERLVIRIYDSGKNFDTTLDKGYGISSVYNKLDLICKNDYRLEFINEPRKYVEMSFSTNLKITNG